MTVSKIGSEILDAIDRAGLAPISPAAAAGFAQYLDLLLRWNTRVNLTAVRDPKEIVHRHFLDCIQCAQTIPAGTKTLLDYGSGAGLPGIPIALCRPEIKVTLAESIIKKASFLREAARTLRLETEVFVGRVDVMPADRRFEAVTLRAVDKMSEALPDAASRLDVGGLLVIFASIKTSPSFKAALRGLVWQSTPSCVLPGTELLLGRAPESLGSPEFPHRY